MRFICSLHHPSVSGLFISAAQTLMEIQLNLDLYCMFESIYLGVEAHCILGGFVEFRVFEHVLFPAGAFEDAQSQRGQSSEDLINQKGKTQITEN